MCAPLDDGTVTSTLGSGFRSSRNSTAPVPPAQRTTKPGWRDPRLWTGVLLIATSVVVGARIMSAADETTAVWAVEGDLLPGDAVLAEDLTARSVRFVDAADREHYLLAKDGLPPDVRLTRAIGAGELLPRSALGTSLETGVIEVPITVEPGQVPPSVGAGSIVNVWVTGESFGGESLDGSEPAPEAVVVLEEVVVIEAPRPADAFGASGERQLVIGVPADQAPELAAALSAAASGRVVITRQG